MQLSVQLFSLPLLMQLSVQLLSLPLLMQLPLLLFWVQLHALPVQLPSLILHEVLPPDVSAHVLHTPAAICDRADGLLHSVYKVPHRFQHTCLQKHSRNNPLPCHAWWFLPTLLDNQNRFLRHNGSYTAFHVHYNYGNWIHFRYVQTHYMPLRYLSDRRFHEPSVLFRNACSSADWVRTVQTVTASEMHRNLHKYGVQNLLNSRYLQKPVPDISVQNSGTYLHIAALRFQVLWSGYARPQGSHPSCNPPDQSPSDLSDVKPFRSGIYHLSAPDRPLFAAQVCLLSYKK